MLERGLDGCRLVEWPGGAAFAPGHRPRSVGAGLHAPAHLYTATILKQGCARHDHLVRDPGQQQLAWFSLARQLPPCMGGGLGTSGCTRALRPSSRNPPPQPTAMKSGSRSRVLLLLAAVLLAAYSNTVSGAWWPASRFRRPGIYCRAGQSSARGGPRGWRSRSGRRAFPAPAAARAVPADRPDARWGAPERAGRGVSHQCRRRRRRLSDPCAPSRTQPSCTRPSSAHSTDDYPSPPCICSATTTAASCAAPSTSRCAATACASSGGGGIARSAAAAARAARAAVRAVAAGLRGPAASRSRA